MIFNASLSLLKTLWVLLAFYCAIVPTLLSAQVTITVTTVPEQTSGELFIAGNFNGWQPGKAEFQLQKNRNGYTITFTPIEKEFIEFKITRGNWDTGEVQADGSHMPNRVYPYTPGMQITVEVSAWQDQVKGPEKLLNPEIIRFAIASTELETTKNIKVYLPKDYHTTNKKYPVLYMMDGENLFDDAESFAGEWGVDEAMDTFFSDSVPTAIVIGIDHGSDRLNEYMPWINSEYGGGKGEAFADFLVHTLKPHIDSIYRTLPDRENTMIAGSSLGGLMSMYIVLRNNDVFAKACVFSPSFFINPEINAFTEKTVFKGPSKIYFYMGGMEDDELVDDMRNIYNIVTVKEISGNDFRYVVDYNNTHTEAAWRYEFPIAFKWLMEK